MIRKPKQIIGVELGTASLKAAVIESSGSGALLLREYAIQSVEGGGHDLLTSLGLLLGKLKTSCRDCAIAAWPDSALFRFLEHDPTGPAKIQSVLNSGTRSSGQDGTEGFIMDFVDAGKGSQSEKGRLYVACGVPRSEILAARELFHKIKYNIQLFQLSPIAVLNAFQASLEDGAATKMFLCVDFGKKRSSLCGGDMDLHLMREIAWGADDLYRVLREQRLLGPGQTLNEVPASNALQTALAEAIPPLIRQIEASRDYLRNQVDSGYLSEIHISGGLSANEGFVTALQEALGMPCNKWNPFRRMQATNRALKEEGLLVDLFRLQSAAGAAIQYLS